MNHVIYISNYKTTPKFIRSLEGITLSLMDHYSPQCLALIRTLHSKYGRQMRSQINELPKKETERGEERQLVLESWKLSDQDIIFLFVLNEKKLYTIKNFPLMWG